MYIATAQGSTLRGQSGAVIAVLLVLGLIWGCVALQVRDIEDAAWREARGRADNLARVFEENIVGRFDAINETLMFARESYLRDPAHFNLSTWARDGHFLSGLTIQIGVVDSNGILMASNLGPVTERIDLSDREHIKVQKQSSEDRLFISVPLIGRVSGRWSLNVTRRMVDADGHYAGAVVVSIDPYFMSHLYESVETGNELVFLAGFDGIVRARAPINVDGLGHRLIPDSASHMLSGAESGTFQERSPVDHIERLITFRRVGDYPLVVAVGVDCAAVVAAYRDARFRYYLFGGALTTLALLVAMILTRQRVRVLATQAALTASLDISAQGMLMVDAAGTIAMINRRALDLLRLPGALRRNTTFRDLLLRQIAIGDLAPEDLRDPRCGPLLAGGNVAEGFRDYERIRPDGTVLQVRTRPLAAGGAVRTYADVTDRRLSERDLTAARDAAQAAARTCATLVAGLRQELQVSIGRMIGLARGRHAAAEPRHFHAVAADGENALRRIDDVADTVRREVDRLELELARASFDIRELSRGALAAFAVPARAKALRLILSVAEDVPAQAIGDTAGLRQVLLHLIGNAVRAARVGSVRVSVVRQRGPDGTLRLGFVVGDTGVGMPADSVAALLGKGRGMDGTPEQAERESESDLELAATRCLIERMGGHVEVESVRDAGNTIRFDVALTPSPRDPGASVIREDEQQV